ncbi:MAG TPA: tRNA lysidine(34) synthetase TilS [Dissulfurispiraceae bacterium]|nr:tRNA lysidine(34) synthetase TilS [Dissulfurispiraceae bacterium]
MKLTVQKHDMLRAGEHVLVGLSGGADSVCLLTVLDRLKPEMNLRITAAYLDHGLRPDETPQEIDFCRDLCGSFDIAFHVQKLNVLAHAKTEKLSKQESARELRYRALQDIAAQVSAHRIAVGHHADDQAETILMRLFRGTGPSGMAGIRPVRKNIIRPLIDIERKQIESFLDTEGIGFMVDSSNLRDDYMRNKLRHHVMPAIKKLNCDVIKTMSRTAEICRDEERYFEVQVTKTLMKLISRKTDSAIELFLTPLEAMDRVILRRVLRRALDETRGLREIGLVHIEEIIHLIRSGAAGDRIYLPGGRRAIKKYSTMIITADVPQSLEPVRFDILQSLPIPKAGIVLSPRLIPRQEWDGSFGDAKTSAIFDEGKLILPLTVRSRVAGDFFYPFGFGKRKKLQDFFVDEKVARDERDVVPLLVSGDAIAWVIGHRVDARYAVDDATEQLLQFHLKPLKI